MAMLVCGPWFPLISKFKTRKGDEKMSGRSGSNPSSGGGGLSYAAAVASSSSPSLNAGTLPPVVSASGGDHPSIANGNANNFNYNNYNTSSNNYSSNYSREGSNASNASNAANMNNTSNSSNSNSNASTSSAFTALLDSFVLGDNSSGRHGALPTPASASTAAANPTPTNPGLVVPLLSNHASNASNASLASAASNPTSHIATTSASADDAVISLERALAPPKPTLRSRLSGPLSVLSASPDKGAVIVGGKDVLKVLTVRDTEIKDLVNLRAGVKNSLNFSLTDVKWANSFAPQMIASAYLNGDIVIWDLNRGSQKQANTIKEHDQSVNRLSFHPNEPILLLSASQDATIKLWDLRQKAQSPTTFEGRADKVRDVQFSPTSSYDFIAAFENGEVQKWDIRKPSEPERRWNAHFGLALTIDWHPDGTVFASAGRDRVIKVWDTKADPAVGGVVAGSMGGNVGVRGTATTATGGKPMYSIQTIGHVARIAWRPRSQLGESAYQIASCSLQADSKVSVWDLGRGFVAEWAVEEHDAPVTDFLWHDSNVLWTVSKDHTFVRQTLEVAGYRPASLLSSCAMSWNALGDITFSVPSYPITDSTDDMRHGDLGDITMKRTTSPKLLDAGRTPSSSATPRRSLGTKTPFPTTVIPKHSTLTSSKDDTSESPLHSLSFPNISKGAARSSTASSSSRGGGGPAPSIVSSHPGPPPQTSGVAETELFHHTAFQVLAHGYDVGQRWRKEGRRKGTCEEIWDVCFSNSEAAADLDLPRASQTWRFLQLLFGIESQQTDPPTLGVRHSAPNAPTLTSALSMAGTTTTTVVPGIIPAAPVVGPTKLSAAAAAAVAATSQLQLKSQLLHPTGATSLHLPSLMAAEGVDDAEDSFDSDDDSDEDDYRINQEVLRATTSGFVGVVAGDAAVTAGWFRGVAAGGVTGAVAGGVRQFGFVNAFQVPAGGASIAPVRVGYDLSGDGGSGGAGGFIGGLSDESESDDACDQEAVAGVVNGSGTERRVIGVAGGKGHTHRKNSSSLSLPLWTGGEDHTVVGRAQPQPEVLLAPAGEAYDGLPKTWMLEGLAIPQLDREDIVHELLRFYGELGNAQMCATICLVLEGYVTISSDMKELWFSSYVDLLLRFGTFNVAARVMALSNIPSVSARNQESTTIHSACGFCSKPIPNAPQPGWICERCKRFTTICSYCRKPVKGTFSWCHGCQHGGHLNCLERWFAKNSECPSGCGHLCK